jgi:aminoglycoside/choline kinase family phosphotransferase
VKADITQWIAGLFEDWSGEKVQSLAPLPESGSYRRYYRISGETKKVLGAFNTDLRENDAFLYLAGQLKKTGNRVPDVYTSDKERGIYLLQDLGDKTLLDLIQQQRQGNPFSRKVTDAYRHVIEAMPGLQIRSVKGMDFARCYPRPEFEYQSMHWDLNYFKYCFLKPMRIGFDEQELEDDFKRLIAFLLEAGRDSFMFRDFQSRNIMMHEDSVYFIDFQGGRRGPLQYDLASLLFEAKTSIPFDAKQTLLDYYLEVFHREFPRFDPDHFMKYFHGFVYIRLMQAMGAYGFRGYIERKPLFLQSVPLAANTLEWLVQNVSLPVSLPCLFRVFDAITGSREIREFNTVYESLTVTIHTFSYKNGIPADNTGNGGGFVFDCRALPNPGKYEEFKDLTGKDAPVIKFLEEKEEMNEFMAHAVSLVDQAVTVYQQRGFTSLMVNFGCTGGQHRSVYAAEKLAAFIRNKYPVNIVIRHRELEEITRG